MLCTREVTVQVPDGLHHQTAARFIQTANRFTSVVRVVYGDNNVNAKSLLGVLSLSIGAGTRITITADGADAGEALDALLPHIRHRRAFGAYARRIGLERTFKPGHYVLKPGMSVIEVARMLKLGMQTPVRVTINNVRIPAQLAQKLARQIDADSAAIMRALTSKELAAEVGFDSVTLF